MPAVLYTWDPRERAGTLGTPYVSPQVEQVLGFTVEEWSSDPELWIRQIHPDDRERVLEASERADQTGEPFSAEYRHLKKDGTVVWVRDEAVVVERDAAGKPTLSQGIVFDITERKLAEERLLQAEERFRSLVEQIPAVTFIEDPSTGQNLYTSPQVEEMFGYTAEEWNADPTLWEQRLHPDDRDRVVAENEADLGDRWSVEYRSIHRDGHVVWVRNESVLLRDREGRPLYWQGVVFDITERRAAEEQLRQAEETYRTLVEQLPIVVYQDALDDTSTALYISPQYERVFGYPPEARTSDPNFWIDHLHPDDRDWVLAESRRTNETGEPFVAEYRFLARDGRVVWVRDEAILQRATDGTPLRWQGILMDITERKLAEATLSRRDAVLEAVGFAAARFLRAHDPDEVVPDVLEHLGVAAGASRVFVFENETLDDGALAMTLRREWLAPDIPSIDDPSNRRLPYREGFQRWESALSAGRPIVGPVRDFPGSERESLTGEAVLSLALVPVFVGDEWWGFLGFDDCETERSWPAAEVEALRAAADTLGAAIGRERAERRLSEAEGRYRTLVEQLPLVTYVDDVDTDLTTYVSPQIEQLIGYTPEEWLAQPELWYQILHPDDREAVIAEDARTTVTGDPLAIEYRFIARDGRVVWVRDDSVLLRDEHGRPVSWQGLYQDITERKVAVEQLSEAEQRYRTLVETISAVTYIDRVDELSTTLYVSPQIETLFGYSPEDWKTDPAIWADNLHPEDRDRVLEAIRRHNVDGEPYSVEYRFRTGDGRWAWVRDQATIVPGEGRGVLLSQGVMFDVTAAHDAEEQLREAEQRYRAIVEHVPAAIYVDRPDGSMQTVYVSPQIEQIMGITPQEYLDDPEVWLTLMPPEQRGQILDSYFQAIAERRSWKAEYPIVRPDGREVWVHDETTFLLDEEGEPAFLQGVMFDITERKLAEHALRENERREREAAERLRALDEMKNTFLAAVSHELRSPLTSILGLALTLEQQDLPPEDRSDLTSRLAANARKLDRLLKDLLDIDRLNRGIVTPNVRQTDVGALVRRTVESLDLPGERSIAVEAEPVTVPVDPAKVERIVENLLANAARHTRHDARIWVRVWAEEFGVVIAVEDDGSGVPPELRQEIFEPFRQGPTASSHSPGTGIGLSLVAMFADLHGGRAWVEDREGGGASFRVFLPFIPPGPSAGENGGGNGSQAPALGIAGTG